MSGWGGYVYFVTDGVAIKIGHASSPRSRLGELQVSHHVELQLMHDMPGKLEDEFKLHERFRHLHIRGEWFRREPELLDYIEELREAAKLPFDTSMWRWRPPETQAQIDRRSEFQASWCRPEKKRSASR